MTLTRTKKIILGLLAFWPPLYMIIFNIIFFSMFDFTNESPSPPDGFFAIFAVIFVLHMGTILSILGQMVFYMWHCLKENRALQGNQNSQIIWLILLFMFNVVVNPIYWFKYIWHEPAPSSDELGVAQSLS